MSVLCLHVCLGRVHIHVHAQCSFIEYRGLKVVYRRYASLFFVVAVDGEDEVSHAATQSVTPFSERGVLLAVC